MEIKVNTQELNLGMYVSKLDRPWLDTPFILQGFTINKSSQIDTLKKYCDFVYVDTDGDKQSPSTRKGTATSPILSPDSKPNQIRHTQHGNDATHAKACTANLLDREATYEDVTSVDEEIKIAKEINSQLSSAVCDYMKGIHMGESINFAPVRNIILQMIESIIRNPDAFMLLLRIRDKDSYTYNHSIRASALAIAFGRQLGLAKRDLQDLGFGVLLMDVGKMMMPDYLLAKSGPLTEAEHEVIKKHRDYSVSILRKTSEHSERILEIAAYHHERFNGNGYPDKLRGNEIPVFARIAAIVDCFDAITSNRCYAKAISPHEAIRQLYEWRNIDFQEELVEQFIQTLGVYPSGTIVELNTGEIGIVISQSRVRRLRPKIMIIIDKDKQPCDVSPILDLLKEPEDSDGNLMFIQQIHEPGTFGINPEDYYL